MDNEFGTSRGYDDEPRYDRDRSASPRGLKRDDSYRGGRDRSASPNGRMGSRAPPVNREEEEAARNPGTNLFVTGLSGTLNEDDVRRMFEKYGEVTSCAIMKDPHSGESRGFGFVEMATTEQADAARENLQGENVGGRTLSIERARRARPRTPTPGRYFGPPKREDDRPRRGGYGGYGRDDFYRGGGGYDDRRYGSSRRDDYSSRGIDRYASSSRNDRYGGRDDRYGRDDRRDDRRGGDRGADPYYSRDAPRGGGGGGGWDSGDRYDRR